MGIYPWRSSFAPGNIEANNSSPPPKDVKRSTKEKIRRELSTRKPDQAPEHIETTRPSKINTCFPMGKKGEETLEYATRKKEINS